MRRFFAVAVAVAAMLLATACSVTSTPSSSTSTTTPTTSSTPNGTVTIPGPIEASRPPQRGQEPATFRSASGCGQERWAVKTLTDPAARQVNLSPQDSTVADLASIAPPADPTDRVAPTEMTTFRVHATITAIKREADSDYHLALADGQGHTMIAESPSVSCDAGSVVAGQIAAVRSMINAACPNVGLSYQQVNIPADLTGVGFFDRIHGQRGVAPDGIELHPLVAITLAGKC